jgi:MOSC domain-containing protein YiiM
MAAIVSIVYTPASVERKPPDFYARVSLQKATLLEGGGIDGDLKGRNQIRNLNIMAAEILEQLATEGFQTGPGEMGEQIVVSGVDLGLLKAGDQLRLGESAIVEMVLPRTGCDRFEHIQKHPKGSVRGRLGIMAKVVAGGEIHVGDPVSIQPLDATASGVV